MAQACSSHLSLKHDGSRPSWSLELHDRLETVEHLSLIVIGAEKMASSSGYSRAYQVCGNDRCQSAGRLCLSPMRWQMGTTTTRFLQGPCFEVTQKGQQASVAYHASSRTMDGISQVHELPGCKGRQASSYFPRGISLIPLCSRSFQS